MKRQQSIIDYVREDLDPHIWEIQDNEVKLRQEVKAQIIDTVMSALDDFDIPESAVKGLFVYGSLLTNQYNEKTDLDCRLLLYKEPMDKLYPGLTGEDIFDYLRDQLHEIPLDDSRHPLNVSIMIEGEDDADQALARTKYDAVYDVLEDKFIQEPVFSSDEFDPQEEFKEERDQVAVVMEYLDSTLRDAKTKTIDYAVLEEAITQVKHPEELRHRLETKLQEIQTDLTQLVEDYEQIKEERTKALTTETEDNPHKETGNLLYKYLERYQYLDMLKKIKHIMKRGLDREEIPEVEEALKVAKLKGAGMKHLSNAIKTLADVMSGPPAAVERNPDSFNRACFMCGWESSETIEGAVEKNGKCPRCGANLDQPMAINTAPNEEFLTNPKEISSKESK